jgi:succinate dehydrogenase hydrophobic membrane anchor protein
MGTFLWLAQRFSSLIILSYILFILINYYVKPYGLDAQSWFIDITSVEMKIFTSLFLIAIVGHALQGLKAIEDDYLTERTIGMFLPGINNLAKILRYSYRAFISLVIIVLSYVTVLTYLMEV